MKQLTTLLLLFFCFLGSAMSSDFSSIKRVPSVVISFERSSSDFNNYLMLLDKVSGANGVMISVNTNSKNIVVADKRIENIVKNIDKDKFVFVTFRYTNNILEHGYVEVFTLQDKNEFPVLLKAINKSSLVSGLGRLYTEDDVRKWRYEVDEKVISLDSGMDAGDQLSILLKSTGWDLLESPVFLDEAGGFVESLSLNMKVILVNGSAASVEEVRSLVSSWLDVYKQGASYAIFINKNNNSVVIK
jgi:hypothetical protein